MFAGSATSEGTARFAGRFAAQKAAGFYRQAQALTVSTIGFGTYLGEMDDATNRAYEDAIGAALDRGINFIDTSLNYRNQRSEQAIFAALQAAIGSGRIHRDEVVVCTKAGYLVPKAVPEGVLKPADIVGGMHSMAPAFLDDQLRRSRQNLGLETIDVFYLHNPETQLSQISPDEFHDRIRQAFTFLENAVEQGSIRFYGTATWDGYRRRPGAPEGLSLSRLAAIANEIAGTRHHFRFIQLPFNFAMPEAFVQQVDGRSVLIEAQQLGVTVVASASLLQARLARGLPEELGTMLPGTATDAQRCIQFTRSTPGIAVALVGMSQAAHVGENLALANTPPLPEKEYLRFYKET